FRGQMILTYLGGYGLGRVFIEGLRTDSLMIGSLAVSQILSGALAIVCVAVIVIVKFSSRKKTGGQAA
ncbi:MAG: prolipoprotein diacylglyceryl transferase, partial [Lachnospiraceae bacterium]|nr:prolipoprotein diacylglyceryl transferase [Lachnospiraceae bacterium]